MTVSLNSSPQKADRLAGLHVIFFLRFQMLLFWFLTAMILVVLIKEAVRG